MNVCIEKSIYKELEIFCEEAGQTKTIAVERALVEYLEGYKKKQKILQSLEASYEK